MNSEKSNVPDNLSNRDIEKKTTSQGITKASLGAMPRVSAWSGALGFPFFFVILTIAGLITPGYSPVSEHGSDLSVLKYAWLFNYALTVYGISLIIFSVGFYRAISPIFTRRRSIAVNILLVLSAVGGILAGVFTVAPGQLYIHAFGGLLIFGLPPLAQIIAGSKLRFVSGSKKYGTYTFVSGIVNLAIDIFGTFYPILKFVPSMLPIVNALNYQLTGLYQRIEMIVTWGWFPVTGVRSLTLRGTENIIHSPKNDKNKQSN